MNDSKLTAKERWDSIQGRTVDITPHDVARNEDVRILSKEEPGGVGSPHSSIQTWGPAMGEAYAEWGSNYNNDSFDYMRLTFGKGTKVGTNEDGSVWIKFCDEHTLHEVQHFLKAVLV